jgi:prophage tail gpP-like protein
MFKLKIKNKIFNHFQSYDIGLKYNAIADNFSFTALKEMLPGILEYPECSILDDEDNEIVNGIILNQSNKVSPKSELITVSGYSKCGILEDINIPTSLYPLQSDKLSLKQITDKLLSEFDIQYIADASITSEFNKVYRKNNANVSQSIKDYISSLASQRGIILTHTGDGKLHFTKLNISSLVSVKTFRQGSPGIMAMSLDVPGQSLHSEITVMKQASSDNPDAGEKYILNPYVSIYRPKVVTLNSGDIFDLQKAARNELSNELSQIKLTINTLFKVYPGNLITIIAPGLRVNNAADFFVEEVSVKGSTTSVQYTLSCVLKDVYTDTPVVNIFEDIVKEDYSWGLPKF